jgi:hypothetical protein
MAPIPSAVEVMNSRLAGKNICRPRGKSSGLPILNVAGGPKMTSGTKNLKDPMVIKAAGIPALLHASHVRNSCLVNFLIHRPFNRNTFAIETIAIFVPSTYHRFP